MARRIALVVAALIAALLVLTVVPLGLAITANERASFRFGAQSAAHDVSAQAEEYLSDHDPAVAMDRSLSNVAALGDCAAVFSLTGAIIAATPCTAASGPAARAMLAGAQVGGDDAVAEAGGWLRVAVAVGDDGNLSGTVVFARSTDPLDDRIAALWGWLTISGLGILVLGVALALWLARWVARPLHGLRATAAELGEGALAARAPVGLGPPEVRELAEAFNRMAERTETLVQGHQAWMADVSHQLRTPLTALRLRLDVLAEETRGETAAELAGVQEEIGRFSRLVDGLLAVARAEAAVPRPQAIRTSDVVAERIAAWEPVARERRVALRAEPDSAAPQAYLGPGDLEQILDNLLANALEAVPDGGWVTVAVAAEQRNRVSVRVVDDGPGMGEAAKAAAFHRFGRPDARGNGLGLAIVHRLATANGGTVGLEDTPDGGLTVILSLPTAR
ncbi:MAG TPA: HAMP domain-containing sensor histidine kinase [Actinocrinis sp.]|jgi:signal transduction histidine kinase